MNHTFFHVDMDAFFASVEQRDRPELRGRPVVVGAAPDARGVVAAASYEARVFGIHSAMPSREAARRCPDAVFLPVNGKRYAEVSHRVFELLERYTPLVEPVSIDEAFLDVTGVLHLHASARALAVEIKLAVRRDIGLTASIGIAPNKFLAKLASDLEKPDGLTEVPGSREDIEVFLKPLPVGSVWGIGRVSEARLRKAGIRTIGDLQAAGETRLRSLFGKRTAQLMVALAHGRDDREIELGREEKSLSREHTFAEDCSSVETLHRVLGDLAEDVGADLRGLGKYAAVARLKLRRQNFETVTRRKRFPNPCCDDFTFRDTAARLLDEQNVRGPVRLIGFGVSGLTERHEEQLGLFDDAATAAERRERLSRAVDDIRSRLGDDSIGRAGGGPARRGGRHGDRHTETD